ncbi:MAG: hypothetical protein R6U19_02865 [Bacteroidales bacterium]
MERKIAEGISIVFHPLLIPLYGTLILLYYDGYLSFLLTEKARLIILSVVFLMTFVFPLILTVILKSMHMISSLRLQRRQERTLPFLGAGFSFYLAFIIIRAFEVPGYYNLFLLGATLLIVIAIVVNKFWKISIHMLSLGGLSGLFIALAPYSFGVDHMFIYLVVLMAGATGYARLKLNTHQPAQVYVGYLTGLMFMFSLFQIVA